MLNIALPTGRLGKQVYKLFAKHGYFSEEFEKNNRKLVIENFDLGFRYFLVKPTDVGIYVERGVADIGVVGKDTLLETSPDVYEFLDLDIGKCRLAIAAENNYVEDRNSALIVATKYVNIAKNFFASKNREVEIIKLNGSIELAPILNLSHVILDIVETGSTLTENDMSVIEEIEDVSARLIVNKSSYKFKKDQIDKLIYKIREERGEVDD